MKFSKEKFLKNAQAGVRRQLKDHVDILDGMHVVFDSEYGEIPQYFAGGQEYCLYPVDKIWCE